MIVYYEYLFLINIIINYISLRITEKLTLAKVSFRRFFLSSALVVAIVYLNTIIYIKYLNLMYGIIISIVLFKRKIATSMFFYYFINIFLGGLTRYFNNKMIISIIILIIVFEIINYLLEKKTKLKYYYDLYVRYNGKLHKYNAFLDTGLDVLDSNYIPVIFISDYAYGKLYERININTVSNDDEISIYKVDEAFIKKDNKITKIDVKIAFMQTDYEALLNVNLFRWG